MPKLKFVIACEKVVIDQAGPVSIISMFQRMNIQLQEGTTLPDKAIAPNQWAIFCLWETNPQEVGREFVQMVKFYTPDGTLFIDHEQPFKNDDIENLQIKVNLGFNSMPIWTEGMAEVKVWLKGEEVEVGSYAFQIGYVFTPLPTAVVEAVA